MPLYLGDDYIPTRKEIRQNLQHAKWDAEDMIENGELSPTESLRWIWRQAYRIAKFTACPRGKYWPVTADDFQSRYRATTRSYLIGDKKEASQSMN